MVVGRRAAGRMVWVGGGGHKGRLQARSDGAGGDGGRAEDAEGGER